MGLADYRRMSEIAGAANKKPGRGKPRFQNRTIPWLWTAMRKIEPDLYR